MLLTRIYLNLFLTLAFEVILRFFYVNTETHQNILPKKKFTCSSLLEYNFLFSLSRQNCFQGHSKLFGLGSRL